MENRIREARERVGISQKDLAAMLKIGASTLNGYEKGNHDPKSDILKEISRICGVSVDFLLNHDKTHKIEKSSGTAATALEDMSDKDLLTTALVNIGMIEPGYDLTAEDEKFVSGVFDMLESWFTKKGEKRS